MQQTLRLSAVLVGLAFAQQAYASGYHFGTQSVSAQGTANASSAAAEDASTIFYNPAGLAFVKGTTASGVLNVVVPDVKYTDGGSRTRIGTPTGGNNGGDFAEATAVPHAYLSHQVNDDLTVGFGMFVPFGSKTEYDEKWAGRYNIIGTELKTIALNPSFAFKVSPNFVVGGGLTAQYIEGKLRKAADFGLGGVGAFLSNPTSVQGFLGQLPAALRPAVLATFQNPAFIAGMAARPDTSGEVNIKGDDWGFGFNLGAMIAIDDDTRVGLAYRSKIKHQLKGTAKWTLPSAQAYSAALASQSTNPAVQQALTGLGASIRGNLAGLYTDSDVSLAVDTPESFSVSFYKKMDNLALMGDVTRTRHSRFQELRIDFKNNLADSNTPESWGDTYKFALGGTYQLNDQILLRAGYQYDNSPVASWNRTPSIPDNDRTWLSFGANYKLSKSSSIDVAYSYVTLKDSTISMYDNGGLANGACDSSRNTSSCATIVGSYKIKSSILGVQYNQSF